MKDKRGKVAAVFKRADLVGVVYYFQAFTVAVVGGV